MVNKISKGAMLSDIKEIYESSRLEIERISENPFISDSEKSLQYENAIKDFGTSLERINRGNLGDALKLK